MDEIPSLLLNEAPLPVFSLRLFYQLILYAYADFANFIPKSGIIEVLITFVEMQSTEQSNQMLQKQLYPLLSLLWEKCHLDSIFLLLEFVSSLKIFETFGLVFFIRIHFLFYSFRFYFITNGQLSILLYNLLEFFPFYPSCSSSSQPIHDDHQLSRKLIFLLTQSEEMLQFQTFMARILCETSSSKG